MRAKPSRASVSGSSTSISGRMPVTVHIWMSDSSSALVPIVEPITESWVKKTRLSSAPGLKPVVAPEVTTTPPGLSDLMLCRSEEHTSELQSRQYLVCRLLLEKKKQQNTYTHI